MAAPQTQSYCWASSLLPKRPREQEYQHMGSAFQSTGARSSDFIINPDWVSEGMNKATPFGGRKYRPWSFEFQGARLWPYGTVEARQAEEREYRRTVNSAPVPLSLEPRAVVGADRWSLSSPIRFVTLPSQTAWRSHTTPGCPARDTSHGRTEYNHDPGVRDPDRFQKLVTGTDAYFVGSGDVASNAARYQGDSMYVNTGSSVSAPPYSGLCMEKRPYADKFPVVLPQRPQSNYMNFVSPDWLRS